MKVEVKSEMKGKFCLVTGASRGIGFYVARGLALIGAEVVLASHNRERGENALRRIREYTGNHSLTFMQVNLSSQDDIRSFTESFKRKFDRLDVLVNNAGGFFLKRQESVDGIEMTLALNHLNYFMTTLLLLDPLLAAGSARIVNVASEAHRGQHLRFDDLQFRHGYNAMTAYGQSKLANLLFTYELSRRLASTDVTVNALHPGFVGTHLGKQNPFMQVFLSPIHFFFAKKPEEGAETPVYLASSPQVEGITGKYFIDEEPVSSSPASYDTRAAERLWEVSERLCDLDAVETALGSLETPAEKHQHQFVNE